MPAAVEIQRAQRHATLVNIKLSMYDAHIEGLRVPRSQPGLASAVLELRNDPETQEVCKFLKETRAVYSSEIAITRWFIRRQVRRSQHSAVLGVLAAVDPQLKDFAVELSEVR